jgi:hypothetical protein
MAASLASHPLSPTRCLVEKVLTSPTSQPDLLNPHLEKQACCTTFIKMHTPPQKKKNSPLFIIHFPLPRIPKRQWSTGKPCSVCKKAFPEAEHPTQPP